MSKQAGIRAGERVCVTGASGFIGSHVTCALLDRGYRVRGTVRDPSNTAKVGHLNDYAAKVGGELELVAADLDQAGAFDEAVTDCPYVCHVASSVRLTAPDPQREIVDVAVNGTNNVLDSVIAAGQARRVVVTSSISAIVDESRPVDHVFTESDWNETATLEHSPYPLSKTLAEKAAWAKVEALPEDQRFALVAVHPTMVLGPIMTEVHARSSPTIVRDLLTGKFPMVPKLSFGMVDVRDVAFAHVVALEDPEVEGRFILNAREAWFIELAQTLRDRYPQHQTPRSQMPNVLMYLAALFDKRLSWSFLSRNLSIARKHDNGRSRQRLGIDYRPLEQSILDTAESFIDLGLV